MVVAMVAVCVWWVGRGATQSHKGDGGGGVYGVCLCVGGGGERGGGPTSKMQGGKRWWCGAWVFRCVCNKLTMSHRPLSSQLYLRTMRHAGCPCLHELGWIHPGT